MEERRGQVEVQASEVLRLDQETGDEEDGRDKRGDELPGELSFREGRLWETRPATVVTEPEGRLYVKRSETAVGMRHAGLHDAAPYNVSHPNLPSHGSREARPPGCLTTARR